jgi:hypothetical protein
LHLPEPTATSSGMSWTRVAKNLVAILVFIVFMDLVLFMGLLTTWLIEVPGRLIYGFLSFLGDRWPRLHWQSDALLSGLLWFSFAALMIHLVQVALLRRFRPDLKPTKRRSLATLFALAAILLAAGAGTFCLATAPKTEWGLRESQVRVRIVRNALQQAGDYYHSTLKKGAPTELRLGDPRAPHMMAVFKELCQLPHEIRWISDDQERIVFLAARLTESIGGSPYIYIVLFPDGHVEAMARWPVAGDLK